VLVQSMKIKPLHSWELSPKEAALLQRSLAEQVKVSPCAFPIRTVAGTDISYSKIDNRLFAAVVVIDVATQKILETASHVEEAKFPYVPGLLAFREIPPLLEAFRKLKQCPDAVVCDGQGIAHPRKMGLASHLGLWLDLPTIGCAKTRLIGEYAEPEAAQGSLTPLSFKGEAVGVVFRSKKKTRPLFISPGHKMDSLGCVELIKRCLRGFRLPEPTRLAHLAVNDLRIKTPLLKTSIHDSS
jgi:deoxyribonuclease V